MIVELALFQAKRGQAKAMRVALQAARSVMEQAGGYCGSVFHQGIDDPRRFMLWIEWESVEAHTVGFREGPLFPEWRAHFEHLLDGPPEVSHFDAIAGP